MRCDGGGIIATGDDDRRTLNEPGDVLSNERDTLTMRVSSDGADLALELLGTSDDIFGERISCQLSERWPFHQRRYLFQSEPIQSKGSPKKIWFFLKGSVCARETKTEKGSAYHH